MIYSFIKKEHPKMIENHLHLGGKNEKEEFQVTSRYIKKNQRPWIPVMGEFHYCRVPKSEWEKELSKMKLGGISVVSTYVIWIYHEEEEGIFDFSGNKDIRDFVKLCDTMGLSVLLRIGPWIHGEVRNGGLPDWILQKGIPIRKKNVDFLRYVELFYRRIYQEVREYLFDQNGCVIGVQLDNEVADDAAYLLALRRLAEKAGFLLPFYTVTGWGAGLGANIPGKEVLPVFGGYAEAPWTPHIDPLLPAVHYFFIEERNDSSIGEDLLTIRQPEEGEDVQNYEKYPYCTCELGGGVEPTWLRRPIICGDDIAALAMVKLGCGNNLPGYYMYRGGTNGIGKNTTLQESKASGYPNDYLIRSYDFQAPIGEYGQLRSHYRTLKLQHYFIEDMQEALAPMDAYFQKIPVKGRKDQETLRYSLRTDGKSGFVFVNNHQHLEELAEHPNVQFEIELGGESVSKLVFPDQGMTIHKGSYFILPFGMDLGGIRLRYATAQFFCRQENTWFFLIPQKEAVEYVFEKEVTLKEIIEGGIKENFGNRFTAPERGSSVIVQNGEKEIRIVTLTREEAEHLYRVRGELFVCSGDLYEEQGRLICFQEEDPKIVLKKWNGKTFTVYQDTQQKKSAEISVEMLGSIPMRAEELEEKQWEKIHSVRKMPSVFGIYLEEHFFEDQVEKLLCCYQIRLDKSLVEALEDAYLLVFYQGDVSQIYDQDGNLMADDFYKGTSWNVSIRSLLRERERGTFYVVISNLSKKVYLEKGIIGDGRLNEIRYLPVYQKNVEQM